MPSEVQVPDDAFSAFLAQLELHDLFGANEGQLRVTRWSYQAGGTGPFLTDASGERADVLAMGNAGDGMGELDAYGADGYPVAQRAAFEARALSRSLPGARP